jgi:2-iminobutanoate/2-iminopropanoate deaminase
MLPAILLLFSVFALAAPKPIFPPGVKPVGPYSPGIDAGEFIYVSGQGARDAAGKLAATPEAQIRQTLDNVRAVLQAAGLTMDHVAYAQCYLADIGQYELFNKIYATYFPKNPPARSTVAVTRMPTGTPFEVAAVAVRDVKRKRLLLFPGRTMPVPVTPAVMVGDRVYLTGGLGRDYKTGAVPKETAAQLKYIVDWADSVLKPAGMEFRHLAYANIYVSPQISIKALAEALNTYFPGEAARTIIQTAALPFGAHVQISGIVSKQAKRLGNCTGIGSTVYCSGRGGSIRQALESLKQDLGANGLSLQHVVASNVYVDSIDQFAEMNQIYAGYFGKVAPARTTVQPWKEVVELSLPPATDTVDDKSPRAQVSVIAVRDK